MVQINVATGRLSREAEEVLCCATTRADGGDDSQKTARTVHDGQWRRPATGGDDVWKTERMSRDGQRGQAARGGGNHGCDGQRKWWLTRRHDEPDVAARRGRRGGVTKRTARRGGREHWRRSCGGRNRAAIAAEKTATHRGEKENGILGG